VRSIDGRAFFESGISTIQVGRDNVHFEISEDFLIRRGDHFLVQFFGRNPKVEIPSQVSGICSHAFSLFPGIEQCDFVSAPRLSGIQKYAFAGLGLLRSICLPVDVVTLPGGCFAGCQSLAEVTFAPNSRLETIESNVFLQCYRLVSIRLPRHVRSIDGNAFFESGISTIQVVRDNEHFDISEDFLIRRGDHFLVQFCGRNPKVEIPSQVSGICSYAFSVCPDVTDVTFPVDSKLHQIDDFAFAGLRWLTQIALPACTNFGEHAFSRSGIDVHSGITFRPRKPL
jgi:hypothetical protein